ncbi:MAG TPA: nitroreductase family protein [Armatimonadota bacterium]|jgi:nitroreductase
MHLETLKAIKTRRSIRQYESRPVPAGLVTQLLAAAMQAPSACNQQPWEFVVIDDRAILDAIPTYHANAEMCLQAPLAILVCADTRALKAVDHWIEDCSAATQNLLLAAHDAGLGAVWTAVRADPAREAAFQRTLNLPAGITPLALVPIGYPAEIKEPEDRFLPGRVHHNRW